VPDNEAMRVLTPEGIGWKDGAWKDGALKDGAWKDGAWKDGKKERKCADATGKKMKNFGFREVRVRFLGGFEVTLLAVTMLAAKPVWRKEKEPILA